MDSSQVAKMLSECPVCKHGYSDKMVRHLGRERDADLYHCACQTCGHALLASVHEQAGLTSAIGMLTDLNIKDALQFCQASIINQDECVTMHRLLQEDSRGLCRALLPSSP